MHYQKILLSLTGEADERSVVDEAMKLQSFFDATLSIVVVNDPGAGKSHMMMAGLPRIEESDIREQLRRFGYGDRMDDLQGRLYAQDAWALLLVFQAMDAAGKDSTIRAVLRGINPQGCQVFSFKQPSIQELDHDFLWRVNSRLPERGRIGVFNRRSRIASHPGSPVPR